MRSKLLVLGTLMLAGRAVAQDTTIIITTRDSKRDTTVTIRQSRGQSVTVHLNGVGNRELSRAVQRRLEERSLDLARRTIDLQGRMGSLTGRITVDSLSRGVREMAIEASRNNRALFEARIPFDRESRNIAERTRELTTARVNGLVNARTLTDSMIRRVLARPRIGVSVDPRPRDTDRWGAYVTAVTPGGPADRAGMRSEDIITRIDGQSVANGRTSRSPTDDESLPSIRLLELIGKLEPGKTVSIDVRRNNDNRTLRVTPAEDRNLFVAATPSLTWRADSEVVARLAPTLRDGINWMPNGQGEVRVFGQSPTMAFRNGTWSFGMLANVELAPVNEKLGSYFGTSEGVLVVNVGERTRRVIDGVPVVDSDRGIQSQLEPGDVITAVDGRKVTTPAQLMRVLGTYERGDEFKLQIMRQKRAETLSGKAP